jgi:hypothetical protein
MAGKKGRSGRKGAGKEFADFKKLWQIWSDPKFIDALVKKAKLADEGNASLSIQERFFIRAASGIKERDVAIFKKLYPDTARLEGHDGGPLIIGWEE